MKLLKTLRVLPALKSCDSVTSASAGRRTLGQLTGWPAKFLCFGQGLHQVNGVTVVTSGQGNYLLGVCKKKYDFCLTF